MLHNFNKDIKEVAEEITSGSREFKSLLPKRKTNLSKSRLLEILCEDMNRVYKNAHPYSRKKFKPNTVTLIDFIDYGIHKSVNVLHPYTILITGYGIDKILLNDFRIPIEVLDELLCDMQLIHKFSN